MDIVQGMNEIYVSGPPRNDEGNNSDHVFFARFVLINYRFVSSLHICCLMHRHVDGPLGFIPYVSVYRCIVGMDRNLMYTTHFPIAGLSHNACKYVVYICLSISTVINHIK